MPATGVCIVGCGNIARKHARAFAEIGAPFFFASRDPARAEAFAREHGAAGGFRSYAEALASREVSAVLLCTPHDVHLPQALEAARAGKAIIAEKPIARTLGEADGMIVAARAAGVPLLVSEHFRFAPAVRRARSLLDEGAAGQVKSVVVQNFAMAETFGPSWRQDAVRMGGGALVDGGIHFVSILVALGGVPRSVLALSPPNTLPMEGEDGADLLCALEGGATGALHFTWAAPGIMQEFPRFLAYGTEGSILCRRTDLVLFRRGRDPERILEFPNLHDPSVFRAMHEAFVAFLRDGGANPCPGERGRDDLSVVRAAYKSRRLGLPVSPADVGPDD